MVRVINDIYAPHNNDVMEIHRSYIYIYYILKQARLTYTTPHDETVLQNKMPLTNKALD